MIAKDFLLGECENIRSLLDSTLRFDYGPDGSAKFYSECSTRLGALEAGLRNCPPTDNARLRIYAVHLNALSTLVCRIERSSISEYSWPFVEEFKKISNAICREDTSVESDVPLLVFVLADGGLDAYAIASEANRPAYIVNRLLTIVFPKTLKSFVLLHTILGHELGHAIFSCIHHQAEIKKSVFPHICHAGGQFENQGATAQHLFSASRPADVSIGPHLSEANFWNSHSWNAWIEEVLCDLIGLATFGPAFVAAEVALLTSLDPSRNGWGPWHPLVAWRINLLRRACALLGYDAPVTGSAAFVQANADFWRFIDSAVKADPWFNVLEDQQILVAMNALHGLLGAHPPAAYASPSSAELESLFAQLQKQVPPVGFQLSASGVAQCIEVDFRAILFAGWLAAKASVDPIPFPLTNKLCQQALIQQRAISIYS